MQSWLLAIDFGTSYTTAAARRGDSVEVLEIDGDRRVPSIVLVNEDESFTVGRAALARATVNPDRVAREPKRLLGEPAPVILGGRPYGIEDLVGAVLRHVYERAVEQQGSPPDEVRLTHPATWRRGRLSSFAAAASTAGLPRSTFIAEPIAAALAYSPAADDAADAHFAIYDLGGGTFDTAVVKRAAGQFSVVGRPGGEGRLGGEFFDELLADHLGRKLPAETWQKLQTSSERPWLQARASFRPAVKDAKESLSLQDSTDLLIPLPDGLETLTLTRAELEDILRPHLEETVDILRSTIDDSGIGGHVDAIYLVGGASRIPLVEALLRAAFPEVVISRRGDPKMVTAVGATDSRAAAIQRTARGVGMATPTPAPAAAAILAASTVAMDGPTQAATPPVAFVGPPDRTAALPSFDATRHDPGPAAPPPPPERRRPVGLLAVGALGVLAALLVSAYALGFVGLPFGPSATPSATVGGEATLAPTPAAPTMTPSAAASVSATPPATPVSPSPTVDVDPPTGSVAIAQSPTTSSLEVTLQLDSSDADVTLLKIANSADGLAAASPMAFAPALPWRLEGSVDRAGEKSVFVIFGDAAGNWSETAVIATTRYERGQPPVGNTPPTCENRSISVETGKQVTFNPCSDRDTISYQIVSGPSKGTATGGSALTYKAPSTSGSTSFTYRATDSNGATSATRTVSVTINAPPVSNTPPTCENRSISVESGKQVTLKPCSDRDTISYQIVSGPSKGTATGGSALTYKAPSTSGSTSFTYRATDSKGATSATRTVSVTINSSTPTYVAGKMRSPSNRAIIGSSVTFRWSAGTGATPVFWYSMYIDSTPPQTPCPSGRQCADPDNDGTPYTAFTSNNHIRVMDTGCCNQSREWFVSGLPEGKIYVRLFTKFRDENGGDGGPFIWRDYVFTVGP